MVYLRNGDLEVVQKESDEAVYNTSHVANCNLTVLFDFLIL